jgi:hypothetical protein
MLFAHKDDFKYMFCAQEIILAYFSHIFRDMFDLPQEANVNDLYEGRLWCISTLTSPTSKCF